MYSLSVSGRKFSALAARPSRTGSTPVAMGSKVPVWPIFFSQASPRSTATASNEVNPWGLSNISMPFINPPWGRSSGREWRSCASRMEIPKISKTFSL